MPTDPQEIEILRKIHQFYPIGGARLTQEYPGYQALKNSIENRINRLIRKEDLEPWTSFVNEVEKAFPGNKLWNVNYQQFPSLVLEIELGKKTSDGISTERRLILAYSEIADIYTAYFQDFIELTTAKQASDKFLRRTLFVEQNEDEPQKKMWEELRLIFERNYPGIVYVSHCILFRPRIAGGVPHGQLPEAPVSYPPYDFLFGSMGIWNDITRVLD